MPTTTKDRTEIEKKIVAIVAEVTGEDVANVKPESCLNGEDGTPLGDSLDLIEIVMDVEDEFGIEILDEEFDRIGTVAGLVDLTAGKI